MSGEEPASRRHALAEAGYQLELLDRLIDRRRRMRFAVANAGFVLAGIVFVGLVVVDPQEHVHRTAAIASACVLYLIAGVFFLPFPSSHGRLLELQRGRLADAIARVEAA